MKKNYLAVFALLSMMAVSCQKENFTELEPTVVGESAVYTLSYTIDGVSQHATFNSKAERLAFIRQLVALTREGHNVSLGNGNIVSTNATKEKLTFTTTSEEEAANWAASMMEQGYEVDVQFDKETGEYICVAIK